MAGEWRRRTIQLSSLKVDPKGTHMDTRTQGQKGCAATVLLQEWDAYGELKNPMPGPAKLYVHHRGRLTERNW